jgi:hypothetical protein
VTQPGFNESAVVPQSNPFRVRFSVREASGGDDTFTFALYASQNGGSYWRVTPTTPLRPALSSQYAQGNPTTETLPIYDDILSPTPFIAGEGVEAELSPPVPFQPLKHTELEWALELKGVGVKAGDTFALRLREDDGTLLAGYEQTALLIAGLPVYEGDLEAATARWQQRVAAGELRDRQGPVAYQMFGVTGGSIAAFPAFDIVLELAHGEGIIVTADPRLKRWFQHSGEAVVV